MRVLVLDGHVNPAVVSVRALSKKGYRVSVGAAHPWSKAACSRFSDARFVYPSTKLDLKGFVDCIAEQARREPGTFVLPLTEPTALAVSACRGPILAAGGRIVMPPHNVMLRACDKNETTALAAAAGISTPQTCMIRSANEALHLANAIEYPVVLKARASQELNGHNRVSPTCRPRYGRNREEFLAAFADVSQSSCSVLVQEFVPGDGVLTSLLLSKGQLMAEFSYKRIRSVHPTGFGAALRESVPTTKQLHDGALAVVRALDTNWDGIANVEFRVRPDGTPVFLEVNPRNVHSLALAVYAGVNFPAMLAEMAAQGDTNPAFGYSEGIQCRWLYGDFCRLLYIYGGAATNYPGPIPGRMKALFDFLAPVPGAFHDNFSLDDPFPEFAEWIGAAFRFSFSKFRGSPRSSSGLNT